MQRWKTKKAGVVYPRRRKFLDRSTVMGTFGFMVSVVCRTENVFIFLLFLKRECCYEYVTSSLHLKTSGLCPVFYATVKCSHFGNKKGVSMANLKFKFPWWKR